MKYDTIIIGMGPSSVFCAYELLKLKTNRKILLIENEISAILINTKKLDKRAIVEPPNNNVIRGPREGFIEDINTNIN